MRVPIKRRSEYYGSIVVCLRLTNECPQEPDLPSTSCGILDLRTSWRRCHYSVAFALSSYEAQTQQNDFIGPLSTKNCVFSFSGKHSGREPDQLFASSFDQQQATLSHVAGREIVELGKVLTVQPHQLHQRPKTPNFYALRRR